MTPSNMEDRWGNAWDVEQVHDAKGGLAGISIGAGEPKAVLAIVQNTWTRDHSQRHCKYVE